MIDHLGTHPYPTTQKTQIQTVSFFSMMLGSLAWINPLGTEVYALEAFQRNVWSGRESTREYEYHKSRKEMK